MTRDQIATWRGVRLKELSSADLAEALEQSKRVLATMKSSHEFSRELLPNWKPRDGVLDHFERAVSGLMRESERRMETAA